MKRKEKKNYLSDLLIRKRNHSNTTCHYFFFFLFFFFENHLSVVTNQVLLFAIIYLDSGQ